MSTESSFLNGLFSGQNSHETAVKVDPIYLLMCDSNTTDAYLLAQIVYWHRPAQNGKSKLRVKKDGHYWIAKTAQEWEIELAIKERTVRDALKRLEKLNLIIKTVSRFDGKVSTLIRLNPDSFEQSYLKSKQSRIDGLRQFELTDYVNSYTETTTEITKDKTLSAPLSTESVTDDLGNFPANKSSDNVQFIINTTEQLAQLDLTTPQRTVLIGWLVSHAHTEHDFAPYTGKRTQVMNNLAKQGYLTTNSNGDFSTRLQSTKPKSILFSLTYADLDTAPPEGKKPTDKPFWEGVAAMYCWNDNGLDDWRKYVEVASRNQITTLNSKINITCLALDALHLDDPFTVEEFRWIINHWLHTKFKTVPIAERRFAVSGEAIANNWNAMRVSYKLYKQQQTQTEL